MSITLLSMLSLIGCGRNITESDVKFAGVGLNPDEIGPVPEYYGGLVELDLITFGGGGLSLGTVGFQSYDEVGPNMFGEFEPPYSLVYGLSFIFDQQVPAPDVHHGSIGIGPELEGVDACWTNFEPFSYLMASTVELGSELHFANEAGDVDFTVGRFPEIYPPNPQEVFVYYSQVSSYRPNPVEHWVPLDDGTWTQEILAPANWAPGETVTMTYGGGLPPLEAPVSSIPVPSGAVDAQSFVLPNDPNGLSMEWSGEAYDHTGAPLGEQDWKTCIQYIGIPKAPGDFTADCTQLSPPVSTSQFEPPAIIGQMYTGPWDTTDGSVTFKWNVDEEASGERVTINVRFLGPVDRNDEGFLEPVVVNEDGSVRDPLTCDGRADGLEYRFDESILDENGELPATLQGAPSEKLVEVSCSVVDDGEFQLTMEHLQSALTYAERKNAGGAVFYFSRGTDTDAVVPAVRDQAGMRRDVSPVKVRANSVTIGRFWVDEQSDLKPAGN